MFQNVTVYVNETVHAFLEQLKTLTYINVLLITYIVWMQMFYDETVYVNETVHAFLGKLKTLQRLANMNYM